LEIPSLKTTKMNALLIIGCTGMGKTDLSIREAIRLNVPVICLDRIQCFRELWMTSGRPFDDELKGTERIYLFDNKIGDVISNEAYINRLEQIASDLTVRKQNRGDIDFIIEGGSISLINELMGRIKQNQSKIIIRSYEVLIPVIDSKNDADLYYDKIKPRIAEMLFSSKRRNSVTEIIDIASNNSTFLDTLIGAKEVIQYVRSKDVGKDASKQALIENITSIHFNYAMDQMFAIKEAKAIIESIAMLQQ
jgi:tRNA A37 N6-isopentenylltransferase MiaA